MPTPGTKPRYAANKIPARFNDLVAMMPPRAIHDAVEYDNAIAMLDALLARPRLSKGQQDYLETWALIVRAYEQAHHAIGDDATPAEALAYLLEASGMNASDLGQLLGNRSLGSKLLRGERELSKAHIVKLCEHFSVQPGLFLPLSAA